MRKAFGTTLNDVVMAMCAGALRRYLEERGELPEEPLDRVGARVGARGVREGDLLEPSHCR